MANSPMWLVATVLDTAVLDEYKIFNLRKIPPCMASRSTSCYVHQLRDFVPHLNTIIKFIFLTTSFIQSNALSPPFSIY